MGYVSDAQRKAVHASKADGGKGAPAKMEAPLKLDDNPKFKAAVDAAPVNMNYDSPAKQVRPIVDPMTGMPVVPAQSANNVFSPQTQQVAGQMFGQQMPGMYGSALAKKGCKYKK
jgi:hypothetical protein